jgi:hypothetical protein
MKYVIATLLALGSCVAVAVPCLLTAMQRSSQKRTVADMRTIATAWEALATDRKSYLAGRPGNVSYEELRQRLEPTYIKHLPALDGWGSRFLLATNGQSYSIRSMGRDRVLDPHAAPGATTDFDCDIIYADGAFVSYPEGVCQ